MYMAPYRTPEPFAKDVGEGDGDEEGDDGISSTSRNPC